MTSIKSMYFRNLLSDLYRFKKQITIFVILCTAFFAFIGYKNAKPEVFLSEEQQTELEEYNTKISEYDDAVAQIEKSLELARTQAAELQEYVDNSIYMKLDSQNIQVASAQYGVKTESNTGNILASIVLYINEGGLKEELSEELGHLDVKYWRDIISCSTSGNVLNLTILHHDADEVQKILGVAEKRIMAHIPEVAKVQGNFTLEKISSSAYVKADSNVTNTQNTHRNNLKNYSSNIADLDNKLVSTKNNKQTYIEKNEPTFTASPVSPVKNMIKYTIVGIIFGIILPCAWFALRYVLDNRIRNAGDLTASHLNVLGIYKGQNPNQKDMERSTIGIQLLTQQQNISSVYFNCLSEDELTKKAAEEYQKAIENSELTVKKGSHVYDDGLELKDMISSRYVILIIQTGKTTYDQLNRHLMLCKRFSADILGCIVIE
ncbi:MAG: hypothetical protein ACI4F3_13410 [Enterocloster sp.]